MHFIPEEISFFLRSFVVIPVICATPGVARIPIDSSQAHVFRSASRDEEIPRYSAVSFQPYFGQRVIISHAFVIVKNIRWIKREK